VADLTTPPSPPTQPARRVTARGLATREALLDATAELVAARGFHSVGILDIGAAAGVSGSALYRHFANKQELLVALFDRVVDALLDGAREVAATNADPVAALDALVERHVAFALRDRSIIAVYDQEAHNLPDEERGRLRRNQRAYAEVWADTLQSVRAGLDRREALSVVHGVFGLLNSVADHDPRLPDATVTRLLGAMARAAMSVGAMEVHAR
jgi:AcrR family transcriptional regulator